MHWSDERDMTEELGHRGLPDTPENRLILTREAMDHLVKEGRVLRDKDGRYWPLEYRDTLRICGTAVEPNGR